LVYSAPRVFEIGYLTSKAHRGRDYPVEALDAFVRWIFSCLGAQRIEWQGIVGNPTSWGVAAKVGFQLEGVMRARANQRGIARDTQVATDRSPTSTTSGTRCHLTLPTRGRVV
jgi:RimJ/RimL family protein N-acetyltransferase